MACFMPAQMQPVVSNFIGHNSVDKPTEDHINEWYRQ